MSSQLKRWGEKLMALGIGVFAAGYVFDTVTPDMQVPPEPTEPPRPTRPPEVETLADQLAAEGYEVVDRAGTIAEPDDDPEGGSDE